MNTQSPIPPEASAARRGRVWRWVRDLSLIAVSVLAIQWWQSRDLAGGAAPVLIGLLTDGAPYQANYRDGPLLVHFWATWCPVCRIEQGTIDSIAADHEVITVATTSGTPDELIAYLGEHALGFRVVVDESGDIARDWGVAGVPATFIVGRDGSIQHAGMGYSTELGLRLRLWLAAL